jgi:hypothetical protein
MTGVLVFQSHKLGCITSVPKKFGFGVYTYVPSGLITLVPFVGPLTGVVVTTNGVPSGSLSPVKSPPTVGLSSVVVFTSLSTIGASFCCYCESNVSRIT